MPLPALSANIFIAYSQYRDIHWVFLVPKSCYPHAVDLLMGPVSTLLSDEEPIENLISVIHGETLAQKE